MVIKARYSLRSLLIGTTVVAVLLAIAVPKARYARKQTELSSLGVGVVYRYQADERGRLIKNNGPPGHWLLRFVFGQKFFAVERFAIIEKPTDLKKVRRLLPNLEGLLILYPEFSDKDLEQAAQLHSLKYLAVSSGNVSGEGLRYLAGHPSLRTLLMSNTRIADEHVSYVTSIPKLQELSISGGTLTRDGCERLVKGLPDCKIFGATSFE